MTSECREKTAELPLCVDLDGTLTPSDTLHEGVLKAIKTAPMALLRAAPTAFRSRAAFKRRIAEIAPLTARELPLNSDLVSYLRAQRAGGRRIDLVSAADQSVVDAVSAREPLFDTAIGSDGATNLGGARKLAAIRARHGDAFVYAGDSRADAPVWRGAQGAILAGAAARRPGLAGDAAIEAVFAPPPRARAWMKAMRLHQWAKNLLVFVPFALAGPGARPDEIFAIVAGFLALGLLASAGYVVNDLLDLEADRAHPRKRLRPFASGALTPLEGVAGVALMVIAAATIALSLSMSFAAVAALYFAGTLVYSLALKSVALVDVLALAGLYTARIVAGTTLAETTFSFWLLTFSMFIFMGLAILKRYAELNDEEINETVRAARGYTAQDLALLIPFGASASVASSMIFVIYLVEERFPENVYANPELLWLIFPVILFWQMHMWRAAALGAVREDPVIFALKDPVSLGLGALAAALVAAAW